MDKIFALAGKLGQVHMAGKKFPIFLHAGNGNRKGERSLQLCITFINRTFCKGLVARNPARSHHFFCVELFYHVCMHTKCIHNGAKPFKKSHLNLQKKNPRDQECGCIDMYLDASI